MKILGIKAKQILSIKDIQIFKIWTLGKEVIYTL